MLVAYSKHANEASAPEIAGSGLIGDPQEMRMGLPATVRG